MKAKKDEVQLPNQVKRGRIDLTERRVALKLVGPMSEGEKSLLEKCVRAAIDDALSDGALLRAHEEDLRGTLDKLKESRKTLAETAKVEALKEKQRRKGLADAAEADALKEKQRRKALADAAKAEALKASGSGQPAA